MADPVPPDPDTSPNPLVSKLLDKEGKPKPFVVLLGYFAKSPTKGLVRLYVGLDFSAYYELDPDDVLHTERSDPADPSCPTRAFVKAGAEVSLVQTGGKLGDVESKGPAAYLQGAIAGSYLAAAQAGHAAPVVAPMFSVVHSRCCSGAIICLGGPTTLCTVVSAQCP